MNIILFFLKLGKEADRSAVWFFKICRRIFEIFAISEATRTTIVNDPKSESHRKTTESGRLDYSKTFKDLRAQHAKKLKASNVLGRTSSDWV